jgi:hypothetical protein
MFVISPLWLVVIVSIPLVAAVWLTWHCLFSSRSRKGPNLGKAGIEGIEQDEGVVF